MQNCVLVGVRYSSPTLGSAISNLSPAFTFMLAVIFRFITGTLLSVELSSLIVFDFYFIFMEFIHFHRPIWIIDGKLLLIIRGFSNLEKRKKKPRNLKIRQFLMGYFYIVTVSSFDFLNKFSSNISVKKVNKQYISP